MGYYDQMLVMQHPTSDADYAKPCVLRLIELKCHQIHSGNLMWIFAKCYESMYFIWKGCYTVWELHYDVLVFVIIRDYSISKLCAVKCSCYPVLQLNCHLMQNSRRTNLFHVNPPANHLSPPHEDCPLNRLAQMKVPTQLQVLLQAQNTFQLMTGKESWLTSFSEVADRWGTERANYSDHGQK
jgi:hypothetical protein